MDLNKEPKTIKIRIVTRIIKTTKNNSIYDTIIGYYSKFYNRVLKLIKTSYIIKLSDDNKYLV